MVELCPLEESEAYQTLLSRAHRKTGLIPAPLLVKHALSVTREADWPVQREAMEALLRRYTFGRKDRLQIALRPKGGRLFGTYATRREGSDARPYRTRLESVDPPRGSCDCPDFLRSSLGLCKHLLAILEDVAKKHDGFDKPILERPAADSPVLTWDPVRPLTGPGDCLERIRWTSGEPPANVRRWFRADKDGGWAIRDACAEDPRRRLQLVGELLDALNGGRRDPALHALLREERKRVERFVRDADASRTATAALRTLKLKLYPYQREAVERFLARGRLLLADDMGLGKTAQAIAACHALWSAGKARRGLIIAPASLKPQWLREWQLFTDAPVAVIDGNPEQRREAFRSAKSGFVIANYEQLLRDLEVVHSWRPEIVVLDEAQRMKNWATKTAIYVKKLDPPYRLVLTGTPMENRIDELASILDWVDDFALEPKWRLAPWHATAVDGKREFAGARNLDTLRTRLAGCMVRRVRKDVLKQLPPRTDTCIPVRLTPEQKEEHDALIAPIAALVNIAKKRPLTQEEFLRLMVLLTTQRIISNGLAQFRFEETWPGISRLERPNEAVLKGLCSPKLLELRELIRQVAVEQKRKVVVFSQWRRMLRLADWSVRDLLADGGARAVFFTGQEGQKRRTHNIVDFHDDPDTRVLFASDAGGVGLNLQRAANCCINMELPWNPAVLEQRIGRIYRIGQKLPIDVYNLICEDGIEAHISEIVGGKQAFFRGLFDGTSDQVAFERSGSFLSRIERAIVPPRAPQLPKAVEETQEEEESAEREIEEVIAAADESRDKPAAEPEKETAEAPAWKPPAASDVEKLFSKLAIRTTPKGSVVIEAPPQTASTLAALFQGMARMLQGAAKGC